MYAVGSHAFSQKSWDIVYVEVGNFTVKLWKKMKVLCFRGETLKQYLIWAFFTIILIVEFNVTLESTRNL
jgi:hypothetical protein